MSAATDFESWINDDQWAIWSAHLWMVINDVPTDLDWARSVSIWTFQAKGYSSHQHLNFWIFILENGKV